MSRALQGIGQPRGMMLSGVMYFVGSVISVAPWRYNHRQASYSRPSTLCALASSPKVGISSPE